MATECEKSFISAWDSKFKKDVAHQQFDKYSIRKLDEFISLLPKNAKILDAGCGAGEKTNYLLSKGIDAIGVDSSKTAIAFARKNFSRTRFRVAHVEKLPFENNSFDAVLSIAVLHCLLEPSRKAYVKELHRVLRKDGLLYLLTLSAEDETIDKSERLEENSFRQKSGILFHLSTESELRQVFKSFNIAELRHMKRKHKGKTVAVFILIANKK